MKINRIQVAALLTGLVGLAGLQTGCNIGTPAAYALFGAGTIDAEYELAPVRTVVFVDDRANELPRTTLRTSIADKVSTDLLAEGCITSAIEPRQAITVTRKKEGSGKPMSIAAIGRELDCQQVIYVQIVEFTLQGDGEFTSTGSETGVGVRPTAKVSVKVIDVVNSVRTYPGGDLTGGRELTATMREVDPNQLQSFSSRRAVEDKLALELGEQIAKLFYEHDRIEHGENLGPRAK